MEDFKHQHVPLFGLFAFILSTIIYFLFREKGVTQSIYFATAAFLFILCVFAYCQKIGFGDVLAAIGCFFLVPRDFFMMMSIAFLLCGTILIICKKQKTGFIPYMLVSLGLIQVTGGSIW